MLDNSEISISKGRWFIFFCIQALITGIFACFFASFAVWQGNLWRCIYLLSGGIAFTGLLMLPLLVVWGISKCLKNAGSSVFRIVLAIISALFSFSIHLFLLVDVMVFHQFGYHLNGLVLNLLITPGGFESMGLDWHTLLPCTIGIIVLLIAELVIALCCLKGKRLEAVAKRIESQKPLLLTICAVWLLCLVTAIFCAGVADYKTYTAVMETMDTYPLLPNIRMRHFLRAIGLKENERLPRFFSGDTDKSSLNYPSSPIKRVPGRHVNIVWLVAESLRADMVTEEIMPYTWILAQKGTRFTNHFSGGNGTRPGMFSMFYGLYANNWDSFLRTSRSPLVIDWMQEDKAAFLCQTSAKFTYPEFDRTIFASMANHELKELDVGEPWQRDIDNAASASAFIRQQTKDRPFFLFCFFESTHAPYSFPENAIIRKDFIKHINYTTISSSDAPALYNRTVNAAHHLDSQLKTIFDALHDTDAIKDTIVILTGDHGEEFYEKGRLGHNSTFSKEQMHVPLVILAPGVTPSVINSMSHHTDIVPTIAPFLGVENPASDFSVGGNLFNPDFKRDFFVSCGWDTAVLATQTHKLILPYGKRQFISRQSLTTFDDAPCEDKDFFKSNIVAINQAQHDMNRFCTKRKK